MYFKLELLNRCDRDNVEEIYQGRMSIEPGTEDLLWDLELYAECESYSLERIMYVKTILEANNIRSVISSCK